ncbi:MAG: hypothetical protein K0B10_11065 [Vicingaceae bacterium]|nr:hypothetical protein [Vicingaceae bacterium]
MLWKQKIVLICCAVMQLSQQTLITFYFKKYNEISDKYKRNTPLTSKEFKNIGTISNVESFITKAEIRSNPFELFTIAMINFMDNKYKDSLFCFEECICILAKDNTLNSKINIVFIRLNIASIYQLIGSYNKAIKELLMIIKTFENRILLEQSNNLLASAYNRLGGILLNNFQNSNLAYYPFYKSIKLRNEYYNTYPEYVCDNYLSSTYKLFSFCHENNSDKNYYFKKSIQTRACLLEKFNDEFNSVELFYTYFDYIKFLITKRYTTFLIISKAQLLYKFLNVHIKRLSSHINPVFTCCLMLYRFFDKLGFIKEAEKWRKFIVFLQKTNEFKVKLSDENISIANNMEN